MSITVKREFAFKMEEVESVDPNTNCVCGVYTAINTDDGAQFLLVAKNMDALKLAVSHLKKPPDGFDPAKTLDVIVMPKQSAKLVEEI